MSLRSRNPARCLRRLLIALSVAAVAVMLGRRLLDRFEVAGESMAPSLNPGDYLICELVTPRLGLIRRGDKVVFESPTQPGVMTIKRVAAVEGDDYPVERSDGNRGIEQNSTQQVPHGELYLLGDNPSRSTDSRSYGTISVGAIKAVARIRYRRGHAS